MKVVIILYVCIGVWILVCMNGGAYICECMHVFMYALEHFALCW